jgi:hypothetical protein
MGDWHYHEPTTRLQAHGFDWGIPSRSVDGTRRLERRADDILAKAHEKLLKDSRVRDADGRQALSFDPEIFNPEIPKEPEIWSLDEFEIFVTTVAWIAGLTPSETEVVRLIAQSSIQIGAYGGYEAAALHLDKTINTIRVTWSHAKRKLRDNWAEEPGDPEPPPRLVSSKVGSGHKLITGGHMDVSPKVTSEDRDEAYRNRDLEGCPESDWTYQSSLTEDGFQLGDDRLWATALDAPWRSDLGF